MAVSAVLIPWPLVILSASSSCCLVDENAIAFLYMYMDCKTKRKIQALLLLISSFPFIFSLEHAKISSSLPIYWLRDLIKFQDLLFCSPLGMHSGGGDHCGETWEIGIYSDTPFKTWGKFRYVLMIFDLVLETGRREGREPHVRFVTSLRLLTLKFNPKRK